MADTSLFGRLRRLFSNDVIIRNIGGNELKVADVNKIQTSGRYETNSLIDNPDPSIVFLRNKISKAVRSE